MVSLLRRALLDGLTRQLRPFLKRIKGATWLPEKEMFKVTSFYKFHNERV